MNKTSLFSKVKTFANDNKRFGIGFVIVVVSIYFLIAFISFFLTGGNDYSTVNSNSANAAAAASQVENPTGGGGASFSEFIINDGFGIASFFLVAVLLLSGLKLLRVGKFDYLKSVIGCLLMTVWVSVFTATSFYPLYKDSFISFGGKHGELISEWLWHQIGPVGLWLSLIASLLLIMMYISARTVPVLRNLGAKIFKRKVKSPSGPVPPQADTDNDDETGKHDHTHAPGTASDPASDRVVPKEQKGTMPEAETSYADADTMQCRDSNDKTSELTMPDDNDKPEIIQSRVGDMVIEVAKSDEETVVQQQTIDIDSTEPYDPRRDLEYYKFPAIDLLEQHGNSEPPVNIEEQKENQNRITEILRSFGIEICSIRATVGPTITLYEITPEQGVRIAKIRGLEDDIAMRLKAAGVRIIAPIPGKGTIGIEVPNSDRKIVSMRSIISSKKFQESTFELPIAFGRTITNEVFMVDLAKMPHILVAGTTGTGKSVGLNVIIASLIYKKHPAELKFVMVDPKKVEFSIYSVIEKHFLAKLPDSDEPIITDCTKVIHTLKSLCIEMDERYKLLQSAHVRNIKEYNKKFVSRQLNPEKGHKFMPYIVVIIDEFGDLIMTAGKDIEFPIARIAQLARAVGIHMIIATQRPTTQIITGNIKTNFPARVAFKVSARIDSMVILDRPGAQQLIGNGDMLFLQNNDPVRVQCAFVSTDEVEYITKYIAGQQGYATAFYLPEYVDENSGSDSDSDIDMNKTDAMFEDAARLVVIHQSGSTSLIQRKFSIGYNRAGRIMDQLERAGIVGPADGSKPRQVLCMDETDLQMKLDNLK